MKIYKDKDYLGFGILFTQDIGIFRIGYYIVEIYNFAPDKYNF